MTASALLPSFHVTEFSCLLLCLQPWIYRRGHDAMGSPGLLLPLRICPVSKLLLLSYQLLKSGILFRDAASDRTYLPNWTPVSTSGTHRQKATRALVKLGDDFASGTTLAPDSSQLVRSESCQCARCTAEIICQLDTKPLWDAYDAVEYLEPDCLAQAPEENGLLAFCLLHSRCEYKA